MSMSTTARMCGGKRPNVPSMAALKDVMIAAT
jgi:hypothetical protein